MDRYAAPVDYEKYGRYDSAERLRRARSRAATEGEAISALYAFRNRIGEDGSRYAPEPERYHLYLNRGCPFCHRLLIALDLLGLGNVISSSFVDDERDGRGWAFRAARGADPVNGFLFLSEAYLATDPGFEGHIGVPVLWDRKHRQVVSNDSGDILTDLATQFAHFGSRGVDLYPSSIRAEIDSLDATLHENVNFGVYLVGLARTQADYDAAVTRLFRTLEELEQRLASSRYLHGEQLTVSDIRLWVTLARFDIAYYPIFRANLRRLVDFPGLWRYARRLHAIDAFRRFTDFDQFKRDYVRNFPQLSPGGIVPAGPVVDWSRYESAR